MKPQYLFSLIAVITTGAMCWHPTPPRPVTTTREKAGLEVRITRNAEPHQFEELPVPSLVNPGSGAFVMPKSYLRKRLCAGDDAMLAGVQARLLLTRGEGNEFGELLARCAPDSPICPRAVAALEEDGGLTVDELGFFANALLACDRPRFAELRTDRRLPLDIRERAWMFLVDAGEWSPALDALVDEHLAHFPPATDGYNHFRLFSVINEVHTDSPGLLDASVRLMERTPIAGGFLLRAKSQAVRQAACDRVGCDGGDGAPPDSGIDRREELAACALQGDESEGDFCLDRLVELDWPMARGVATRIDEHTRWGGVLRAFETRYAFDEFARSSGATPQADGGFSPELLGDLDGESMAHLSSSDGLGNDELAAKWATLAPELKQAFFFESADGVGGVRLSARIEGELFDVIIRRKTATLDPRAVLSLLNVMVAERGSPRRFFFVKSAWKPLARYAEPERVAKLVELGAIELADPDEARALEE